MKISVLVPCFNEEQTIKKCLDSIFSQTRTPDEVIVVDDCSTDKSLKVLKSFGNKVKLIKLHENSGNKSYVQEVGLQYVTGDVFVVTDADTVLHKNFIKRVELAFRDRKTAAFAGYVKSLRHNWLTACREIDYIISQNIHKQAQSHINALYVVPGCAGAFRTKVFKKHARFDHDTLTEDLDVTYKLHHKDLKIKYDKRAIVYTQDPATFSSYVNQMRRWAAGGWQNILKHKGIVKRPQNGVEMLVTHGEGLIFAALLFVSPFVNFRLFSAIFLSYLFVVLLFTLYASYKDKREDLILYFPLYTVLVFVNAYIFLEQFVSEVILRTNANEWYHVERRGFA